MRNQKDSYGKNVINYRARCVDMNGGEILVLVGKSLDTNGNKQVDSGEEVLGYTTFELKVLRAAKEKNTVSIDVSVTNTGSFAGKQVVQAYLQAPQGKLGKSARVLCAFEKFRELVPGEQCVVKLHFDLREFASFDDLGKVAECAFVLEQGEYIVHVGDSVRSARPAFHFEMGEDTVCRKCRPYMAPRALDQRLCADGTMEKRPHAEKVEHKPLAIV